jgi:hypothetical protein
LIISVWSKKVGAKAGRLPLSKNNYWYILLY